MYGAGCWAQNWKSENKAGVAVATSGMYRVQSFLTHIILINFVKLNADIVLKKWLTKLVNMLNTNSWIYIENIYIIWKLNWVKVSKQFEICVNLYGSLNLPEMIEVWFCHLYWHVYVKYWCVLFVRQWRASDESTVCTELWVMFTWSWQLYTRAQYSFQRPFPWWVLLKLLPCPTTPEIHFMCRYMLVNRTNTTVDPDFRWVNNNANKTWSICLCQGRTEISIVIHDICITLIHIKYLVRVLNLLLFLILITESEFLSDSDLKMGGVIAMKQEKTEESVICKCKYYHA